MKASIRRILAVFKKEVKDNLRDRRSVLSSLFSGLLGPALMVMLIFMMGRSLQQEALEEQVLLPVVGMEYAPNLIDFLEQNGVMSFPAPQDPTGAVRRGLYDMVLIIPESYASDFAAGSPTRVQIVMDATRQGLQMRSERVRSLLTAYSSQIATLRLLARGVDPAALNPVAVDSVNISTPQSQGGLFLNILPYFVILVVFLGGMYVVIDTTAGERERGSLEPLLINPVPRWEFVVGKLTAAVPFAMVTLILTLLAFAVAFNVIPLEDYIGFRIAIDPKVLVLIFLLALPMILLASALQMIIATFTHSFKEAQTYVAFLPLVPAIPGLALSFMAVRPGAWSMLIPTFGQQVLILQLIRNEAIDPLHLLISLGSTLLISILLIYIAVRLYERERILFTAK
jgi:sodium transport system permease protein